MKRVVIQKKGIAMRSAPKDYRSIFGINMGTRF